LIVDKTKACESYQTPQGRILLNAHSLLAERWIVSQCRKKFDFRGVGRAKKEMKNLRKRIGEMKTRRATQLVRCVVGKKPESSFSILSRIGPAKGHLAFRSQVPRVDKASGVRAHLDSLS
jgi:hypothetical protein